LHAIILFFTIIFTVFNDILDWESEQSLSASIRVGDTPPILSKLNSSAHAVTTTRAKDGGGSHISLPTYSQTGLSTDSLVR